ncbi:tetratricopeptide repeat protein [Neolewinella sp.]|uniref:tetratricopeptide repeat protein n=1 Tax=Neolewinella sp. TaxID=2993543 RepID=UPI003B516E50
MQDGRHLAELLAHHRSYRTAYLDWAADHDYPEPAALHNYRRALVGWYETSMDPERPYRGDVLDYLTTVAAVYFGQPRSTEEVPLGNDPLQHLPHTITLDATGQQLLAQFESLPEDCRQLLLLADYHHLTPTALARALDDPDLATLHDQLEACRTRAGIDQPDYALHWPAVITLAGRKDLLSTLTKSPAPASPTTSATPTTPIPPPPPATQQPNNAPRQQLSPAILLAGLLFGVFLYLAYTTFGGTSTGSLYDRYFAPYPNIFADQPPQTDEERDLQRILYYYDRSDYRTAYDELLPTADAYPVAPLYLGVTALELDNPERAREWFKKIPADSPYRDAAEWYSALAQLAQGGAPIAIGGAKASIQQLANSPGHPYQTEAKQLLSDL